MRFGIALACALSGCSLVNDPGVHRGGTPDAGTDAGPPTIAPADACSELVRLFCEARIACCPAAAGEDFESCRADAMTTCQMIVGPYVTDGRTGYDPVIAGAVVAEARRLAETCDPDIVEVLATKEGLLSVFQGVAPEGGSCSIFDAPTLLSCRRRDRLVCQPMGLGFNCLPERAEAEACAFSLSCETGLYCPTTEPRTCAPQLGEGQPCMEGADCQSYVCDTTTMECGPRTQDVYCEDPFAAFRGDRG
jgi:hypothetical protein